MARTLHKTRSLALPFLVTVAAGGACTSKTTEPRTLGNPPMPVDNSGGQPEPADAKQETKGAETASPADGDAGLFQYAVAEPGQLRKVGPAQCEFSLEDDCGPDERCNPPPPLELKCEGVTLEEGGPPAPGRLVRYRDGGACAFEYAAPKCPPGVMCNPPAPAALPCPEGFGE